MSAKHQSYKSALLSAARARPSPHWFITSVLGWVLLHSPVQLDARAVPAGGPATPLPGKIFIKLRQSTPALPKTVPVNALPLSSQSIAALQKAGATGVARVFSASPHAAPVESGLERIYEVTFDPRVSARKILPILRKDKRIEYAEAVNPRFPAYIPNDPGIVHQKHLKTIQAFEAWDIARGGPGVLIAIVDTGVDWQHPDLAANIWHNPGEIPENGIDDDSNGYVDDVTGWDFAGRDNDPRNAGSGVRAGHGTHVAGLACAVADNNLGGAGIAYECKILPIKVSYDASLDPTQAILFGYQGIKYAADAGAKVINLSWGGAGASRVEQEVIDYAVSRGALIVAAAGNENADTPFYPAAYAHVLAVTATNDDRRATYSNFGPWVDLSAPGSSLYSTWPDSQFTFLSGTSMAAPVVAGAAALTSALHPGLQPDALIEHLRQTADDISALNAGEAENLGRGRLNVLRALRESPAGFRIVSFKFTGGDGDSDGTIEAGKTISLSWSLVNYLAPVSRLTISVDTDDPYVVMMNASASLYNLAANDTATGAPFTFRVEASAPSGHIVRLRLRMAAGPYRDTQQIRATLKPLHADFKTASIATTLASFGAIGFEDYAGSGHSVGLGFQFPPGAASALFHGSFMAAIAVNAVSDVAYGNLQHDLFDFQAAGEGEIRVAPGPLADLQAELAFSDASAERPIGIQVFERVLGWTRGPARNFIILEYTLRNTSGRTLNDLYVGQYLDWDINDAFADRAGFDAALQLGYIYADSSNYFGICAVNPAAASHYTAVDNPAYVWPPVDFPDAIKYRMLRGEISQLHSDIPKDWSQLLSFGPYVVAPGEAIRVAFAVVAGRDFAALAAGAQEARGIYATVPVESRPPGAPLTYQLLQNSPNPVAAGKSTAIRYSLARPGKMTLTIINVLGQVVATLQEVVPSPGWRTFVWDGTDSFGRTVAPGVYFYHLRAGEYFAGKKLLVLH